MHTRLQPLGGHPRSMGMTGTSRLKGSMVPEYPALNRRSWTAICIQDSRSKQFVSSCRLGRCMSRLPGQDTAAAGAQRRPLSRTITALASQGASGAGHAPQRVERQQPHWAVRLLKALAKAAGMLALLSAALVAIMPYWLSSRVGLRSTLVIVNRFIPGRVAVQAVRALLCHTLTAALHRHEPSMLHGWSAAVLAWDGKCLAAHTC